jgi:hypothetical protein
VYVAQHVRDDLVAPCANDAPGAGGVVDYARDYQRVLTWRGTREPLVSIRFRAKRVMKAPDVLLDKLKYETRVGVTSVSLALIPI